MELINTTPYAVAYAQGLAPSGHDVVVVVAKARCALPDQDGICLSAEPLPPLDADTAEHEHDIAPQKARCDVLVVGTAQHTTPVPAFAVGLAIGDWRKELRAIGPRRWRRGLFGGWQSTAPEPVDRVPLTWRLAWGGADDPRNPSGIGRHAGRSAAIDAPLPQFEYADDPIRAPDGAHQPAGFGAIARAWSPRRERAGTYDEAWRRDRAPLPPDDLDPAWHQCAPDDQQLPLPDGPLACRLTGLTPDGERRFTLPAGTLPVDFLGADRHEVRLAAHLDTIVIRPDIGDLLLTWRVATRVRAGALGLRQIVVGEMPEGFFRARRMGKRWYRDTATLIAAKRP